MRQVALIFILLLWFDRGVAFGQVVIKAVRAQAAPLKAAAIEEIKDKPDKPPQAPECLRPLINAELSFVKRVCEPTDEQMTAIVEAAKEAHKAMASIITEQGQAIAWRPGDAMFMGPNQERISTNPFRRVREDIAKLLKPLISAEQYAKYTEEAELRDLYEQDAAVGIVLDMIDSRLVLSVDQRNEIEKKLMTGWKELDLLWLQNYRHNPQYMPTMPDQLITPSLSASQRALWTAATQQKVTMYANLNQGNSSGFTEEWIKP
jgi:hypothetical protein